MSAGGLRERKKQKTKAAIQREALRLIDAQGYGETTIEQIAAAADISPSTFFNYFPSKEDVVVYDEYDPQVFAALMDAPRDQPLKHSVDRVIKTLGAVFEKDRDAIYQRARLSIEVPELRARIWEELEKARDLFTAVIAAHTGRPSDDYEIRVVSIALVAAAFEASAEWVRMGGHGPGLLPLFERAMKTVDLYSMLDRLEERSS